MTSSGAASPSLVLRAGLRRSKDPRAIRTRQQIVNAVSTLAHDDAATIGIAEIIAAAGVSRTSFYAHFAGLDELALYIFELAFQRLDEDSPEEPTPGSPTEVVGLTSFMGRVVEHYVENRVLYSAVLAASISFDLVTDAITLLTTRILSLMKNHLAPQGTTPAIVATALASATNGLLSAWLRGDLDATPKQLTEELTRLLPPWCQPGDPEENSPARAASPPSPHPPSVDPG